MFLHRRALYCLILVTLISLLGFYRSASVSVTVRGLRSKVPQVVGLGDYFNSEDKNRQSDHHRPISLPGEGQSASVSGDPSATGNNGPGILPPKPPSPALTRSLVMARTKEENVTWLDEVDLGPAITRKIYIADDPKAPLHPPTNKGHEVMVYLTYIIDHYDDLPDVSIFMHSHRTAWHNNDLLNWDAGEMISRLSSERVQRQGYMNLRCQWMPGCPDWIHPGQVEVDYEKQEQALMADAWAELFTEKPIPAVLSQPCCSQFAVSRDRIHATSLSKYKHYRQWLLRSHIRDSMTGRIFEYLWQVVFADESVFCPNQRACYCDGYGVCFENDETFEKWFELRWGRKTAEEELQVWEDKAVEIEKFKTQDGRWKLGVEAGDLQVPELGKKEELMAYIATTGDDMERRRLQALERGRDPRVRAESAGRPWKEGDGF